jgi:hypothetical protein
VRRRICRLMSLIVEGGPDASETSPDRVPDTVRETVRDTVPKKS